MIFTCDNQFYRTPPPRFPMRGPPQGAKGPGATTGGRT